MWELFAIVFNFQPTINKHQTPNQQPLHVWKQSIQPDHQNSPVFVPSRASITRGEMLDGLAFHEISGMHMGHPNWLSAQAPNQLSILSSSFAMEPGHPSFAHVELYWTKLHPRTCRFERPWKSFEPNHQLFSVVDM